MSNPKKTRKEIREVIKKRKAKKENTDLARLKVLQERLKEIQDKFGAMTPEEQKIVEETKTEINYIKNK
tara:strand:+ start:776 stop:982 length:207 start_codon:yes stop_codon:yes gene_type:complete